MNNISKSSGAHVALMTAFSKANGVWMPEKINEKDYEIKGVIAQVPSDVLLLHGNGDCVVSVGHSGNAF